MDIKLNKNNAQLGFGAKLQLRGNIGLLSNNNVQVLQKNIKNWGSSTDIIDINLPQKFSKNKANVSIAGYINGALEQLNVVVEKNDILGGIVSGLQNAKKIFPDNKTSNKTANMPIQEIINKLIENEKFNEKLAELLKVQSDTLKIKKISNKFDNFEKSYDKKIKQLEHDKLSKNSQNIPEEIVYAIFKVIKNNGDFEDKLARCVDNALKQDGMAYSFAQKIAKKLRDREGLRIHATWVE